MLAAANFVFGKDGRQAFGLLGAEGVNGVEVLVAHLAVEEEEGVVSLRYGWTSSGCCS